MDGEHDAETAAAALEATLSQVVAALHAEGVAMEGIVLKPAFCAPGTSAPNAKQPTQAEREEVARLTLRALQRTLPPAVPAVLFLSGGLSDELATSYLREIARLPGPKPWSLSFSYGRALQAAALDAWAGAGGAALEEAGTAGASNADDEAAAALAARAALCTRVRECSAAALGRDP